MAHLMPARPAPSDAALRAAEKRAEMKRRAKRRKIVAIVVVLAAIGVGGPPLYAWVSDAINESGSTSVDEPAGD